MSRENTKVCVEQSSVEELLALTAAVSDVKAQLEQIAREWCEEHVPRNDSVRYPYLPYLEGSVGEIEYNGDISVFVKCIIGGKEYSTYRDTWVELRSAISILLDMQERFG